MTIKTGDRVDFYPDRKPFRALAWSAEVTGLVDGEPEKARLSVTNPSGRNFLTVATRSEEPAPGAFVPRRAQATDASDPGPSAEVSSPPGPESEPGFAEGAVEDELQVEINAGA